MCNSFDYPCGQTLSFFNWIQFNSMCLCSKVLRSDSDGKYYVAWTFYFWTWYEYTPIKHLFFCHRIWNSPLLNYSCYEIFKTLNYCCIECQMLPIWWKYQVDFAAHLRSCSMVDQSPFHPIAIGPYGDGSTLVHFIRWANLALYKVIDLQYLIWLLRTTVIFLHINSGFL